MKNKRPLISLILTLLLCSILFMTACQNGTVDPSDGTGTGTETNTETNADNTDIPIVPTSNYELSYTSYGDGTCYVSGVTLAEDAKDITLTIPEKSPAGDTVIEYDTLDLACQSVPRIISEEDFLEHIDAPMKQKVENGELAEFYYKKTLTYFKDIRLEDKTTEKAISALLEEYPIAAVTNFYVIASDVTEEELAWLADYIGTYTDYSATQHYADVQKLLELGKTNNIENYDKGITLPVNTDVITSIAFSEGVTSIAPYAFSGCVALKEVQLPTTLKSLGTDTFAGCRNLEYHEYENAFYLGNTQNPYLALISAKDTEIETCTVHENVSIILSNAFENCNKLTYNKKNGVAYLGNESTPYLIAIKATDKEITTADLEMTCITIHDSAFSSCRQLTDISIPNSVTSIGDSAFGYCSNLSSITIPDGITSIGNEMFSGCSSLTSITIPNSITCIGIQAFDDCKSLADINIPNRVKSIGWGAFNNCRSLTSITLPNGITSIEWSTFSQCVNLASINIPHKVTSIGFEAFYDCSSLTSITIPNGVTSIGDETFSNCSNLTSITIPDSVTSIGEKAFSFCSSLTNITIPDGVTSIGDHSFYGCSNLTSITIPDSVTSIGDWAFEFCARLTSITIPDGVTSIGAGAFSGCGSLTSITIPDGITSIGKSTFSCCFGLTSITIPKSVTSIGDSAFSTLGVPPLHHANIYYSGTEEEWNNITIGSNNDRLTDLFTTVHFSSTGELENSSPTGKLDGFATSETATDYVCMSVTYTDKNGELQSGNIVVKLRADVAPITVANFQKLVGEGFYDGLTFHRVYSGFMIQGGDPNGNGTGGSAETIKGEFSSNGVENNLSHTRGVISMARAMDPNSASSQFFIMHADAVSLDGSYAAFGQVIYGMETVDGIANVEVKSTNTVDSVPTSPVNPVTIQKMVFVTPTN